MRLVYIWGKKKTKAGDAINFIPFIQRVIPQILTQTRSVNYDLKSISEELRSNILTDFRAVLAEYYSAIPEKFEYWGWKNPRIIYLLPFVLDLCPNAKFIHVIRDCRNMALSNNQNQTKHYFEYLFKRPVMSMRIDSCAIWGKVNTDILDWADVAVPKQYITLKFEALCQTPEKECQKLFDFVSCHSKKSFYGVIKRERDFNKWENIDKKDADKIQAVGEMALRRFGYIS